MNAETPRRLSGSLLERAAELYGFEAQLRGQDAFVDDIAEPAPAPIAKEQPIAPKPIAVPRTVPVAATGAVAAIDRDFLADQCLLVPGAPVGILAEEFRLVKRQLLLTARAVRSTVDAGKSRMVLVCSAKPNEGKTYCAINLALSMAAEKQVEILLVDADFAKPDLMVKLGQAEGAGLLDALADPAVDVESLVVRTDVPQLSLLPAGTKSHSDTEMLASERTGEILAALLAANPRRIVIFDSPPALAASPASVLAHEVGQIMLVVRADRTTESDLRDAVALLDGCENIQLVLNAVAFTPGGRRFGSYYGYGEEDVK